jgi:hypothetical protein
MLKFGDGCFIAVDSGPEDSFDGHSVNHASMI